MLRQPAATCARVCVCFPFDEVTPCGSPTWPEKVTRWRMRVHWYSNESVHHRLPRRPCAGEINTSQAGDKVRGECKVTSAARERRKLKSSHHRGALRQGEWEINWENEHADNDNRERQPCPLLSDNELSVRQRGEKNTSGQAESAAWWGD